jgi:hypothetical protein
VLVEADIIIFLPSLRGRNDATYIPPLMEKVRLTEVREKRRNIPPSLDGRG